MAAEHLIGDAAAIAAEDPRAAVDRSPHAASSDRQQAMAAQSLVGG
jgi:hypothetical protein